MSRIELTFKRLRKKGRAALIPFVVAGDPDLGTTEALVLKMAESGADIIELGLPFSDPLADGPIIQAASERALRNGTNLTKVFGLAEKLKGVPTPLILMTYFNPVFKFGLRDFAKGCHDSGIDGVIIPDLPPEEAGPWIREAKAVDLDTIFLVAPTSTPDRIKLISKWSRGFIYYVSVTGVTGTRENLPDELEQAIRRVKEHGKKPVAVGFGISTPAQAKTMSRFADGVIVGSAIVKIIEEKLDSPDLVNQVGDFVTSLAQALKS
ncbi:MAG: tryptophan synthase subunit alpha [Desulfobacterales bacterium]|nr:tryptophan synthase subunit alpha [Desulfobacterales bacterium]